MKNFEFIKGKLEKFIKKYYINELIKGVILFFTIGVLYFLITLLIENFLWLNSIGRTILFWLFVVVEVVLFGSLIVVPIAKLLKLARGIDYEKASGIIGAHFPEVSDRLLNLLQLGSTQTSSDLLVASIDQKSAELKPIPFKLAINLTKNFKYLKYAAIPVVIVISLVVFNKIHWISDSYDRVLNYEQAYEPPAPFQFFIVNKDLNAFENTDFVLKVRTAGEIVPDNATVVYNEEIYFLKNVGAGEFEYVFVQPKSPLDFRINANDVSSKEYTLNVVPIPALLDFEMRLDYPGYTQKKDEVIKSSGNATIPEGTKVNWIVHTRNTEEVELKTKDTVFGFVKNDADFVYEKKVFSNLDYEITTSNNNIRDYDNLSFNLKVVKDQYPELSLKSERDSVDVQTMYFFGKVSDDFGLSKLRLVYYEIDNSKEIKVSNIPITKTVFDDFIYAFPDNLEVKDGAKYEFYFEVFDNDVLHNYKSTKSEVFSFRKRTIEEQENMLLQKQNETISGLDKSLDKFKEQEKELKDLSKMQKEKRNLDFNDKKKLEDFLKRQKEQEKMMQDFSKKLKDNLNELKDKDKEEPFKDALKERLERNQEKLKKNEKLLEEIERIADKVKKEELTEKLEELGKENKSIKKNLEQLLELTKRYYVIEKHEKLAEELEDLARKQEELSEKKEEENTKEKQDELNKQFEEFQKQMEDLRKENEGLKKPMKLDQNKEDEKEVKEEQKKASDNLEKQNTSQAKKNQKKAAQKMSKMSKGMGSQMQMSGGDQQQEDMEMLRQVLDNLVDFSMAQEGLMKEFKGINMDNPGYSSKLKKQSVLRENFIHIDDSLYALALRTPQITEKVTNTLTDIEFNIDKSLEKLAENQVIQGAANQQYTVTGSNDLAYLLSRTLDQMQNSMASSGKGKSGEGEFQLPDIIKKQEELNEKMKDGSEKGNKKGEKEGEKDGGNKKGGEKEGGEKEGKQSGSKKGGKKGGKDGEGNGKGDGKGDKQGNKDGDQKGEGKSKMQGEEMNGELYEIFKQQQQLRNALEDRIKKSGKGRGVGGNLLNKMEEVEQELLEKGFNNETLKKMQELKHQLLKLKEAAFEQGEEEKRESKTNRLEQNGKESNALNKAKQYFNTTEILNRQVLPLRQNYKQKVQEYFKIEND